MWEERLVNLDGSGLIMHREINFPYKSDETIYTGYIDRFDGIVFQTKTRRWKGIDYKDRSQLKDPNDLIKFNAARIWLHVGGEPFYLELDIPPKGITRRTLLNQIFEWMKLRRRHYEFDYNEQIIKSITYQMNYQDIPIYQINFT